MYLNICGTTGLHDATVSYALVLLGWPLAAAFCRRHLHQKHPARLDHLSAEHGAMFTANPRKALQ